MKIRVITVGKTDSGWLKEGLSTFFERLKRYLKIEWLEIEFQSNAKKSKSEVMQLEAVKILASIKSNDYVVLLDEKGKQYSSEEFAIWLNRKFVSIQEDIVFVIGGPYGFHDSVKARSSEKLALSEMTFTHQMVRIFFAEQLYRAMTILKNEPYHHS